MSENIRHRTRALLPAIAYGDAAGLPFETKHVTKIQAQYGYVDRLVAPEDNPFFKGDWPAGTTSDDTQLSVAVAESLIRSGGFSLQDQAARHIEAYYETPQPEGGTGTITRGWGKSTTESIERLIAGVRPEHSGHPGGAGNGIVMKLAPLAIWQALSSADAVERRQHYDQLTAMTHDSDIARACTRLHGDVLSSLLQHSSTEGLADAVMAGIDVMTGEFPDEAAIIRRAVTRPCTSFEQLAQRYTSEKTGFQYGFYVPETLAIVYDIMLGAEGDFNTAVFRAVNLGGDCDSTASIVASMMNMTGEMDATPADMHHVQDLDKLYVISANLATIALKET